MARQKTIAAFTGAIEATSTVLPERDQHEELSLAILFKALGDPTRVAIVSLLRQAPSPLTIGMICQYLTEGKSFTSTIAHHLKELKNARLIVIEKIGKTKQCRLNPDAFISIEHYIGRGKMVAKKAASSIPRRRLFSQDVPVTVTAGSNRSESMLQAAFESDGCDYVVPL